MPVVENLEDIWLVTKLQNERKAKEEREKRQRLQVSDPAAQAGRLPSLGCSCGW